MTFTTILYASVAFETTILCESTLAPPSSRSASSNSANFSNWDYSNLPAGLIDVILKRFWRSYYQQRRNGRFIITLEQDGFQFHCSTTTWDNSNGGVKAAPCLEKIVFICMNLKKRISYSSSESDENDPLLPTMHDNVNSSCSVADAYLRNLEELFWRHCELRLAEGQRKKYLLEVSVISPCFDDLAFVSAGFASILTNSLEDQQQQNQRTQQLLTNHKGYNSNNQPHPSQKEANSTTTDHRQILSNLDQVRQVVISNIGRVLERGDKITVLVQKTDALRTESLDFKKRATTIQRTYCCAKYRWILFTGLFVLLVILVLIGSLAIAHPDLFKDVIRV